MFLYPVLVLLVMSHFWWSKFFLLHLNSYLVVTILSHLLHIFWLALSIEKIKVFLKYTLKKKIPDANIFPDKFCPVSGFAIKLPFFQIFFNPSFRYSQIDPFSWSPMSMMSPGCTDPVFLAGIRFSKNLIFEVYTC